MTNTEKIQICKYCNENVKDLYGGVKSHEKTCGERLDMLMGQNTYTARRIKENNGTIKFSHRHELNDKLNI